MENQKLPVLPADALIIVKKLLQLPLNNTISITKDEARYLSIIFFDRDVQDKFNDCAKKYEFNSLHLSFCYQDIMEDGYILRTHKILAIYSDKSVADSKIVFYFILQIII